MDNNQVLEIELIDLKFKVMIQKIDKLYLICHMLFKNSENIEIKSLEVIKEKYLQMYNKIIKERQYEKYREIENLIIKEIAKVELNINQYIYNTNKNYEEIIKNNIESIYKSSNYQNFNNIEQEIQKIGILKDILILYSPYISKNAKDRLEEEIINLKFDLLYRKQVEELIYEDGGNSSNLVQYDNKNEKLTFERLLQEKINLIKAKFVNPYKNNIDKGEETEELFKMPIEQVLRDSRALERLIIIDMKKNPYNYFNLLKAKVFNAHLCNIGNNTFKQNFYITKEDLCNNYSLLEAVLRNIITDEEISIIDCEKIYRKFGFECKPILVNIGQQCVKMILNEVKGSQEYINILNESDKKEENREKQYCRIKLIYEVYNLENEDTDEENLFDKLISKRDIHLDPIQRKRFFSRKKKNDKKEDNIHDKKEDNIHDRKEKIKREGVIPKDINIIVLLIKDILEKCNDEKEEEKQIAQLQQKYDPIRYNLVGEFEYNTAKYRIEKTIERQQNSIQFLEELKNKNKKLTLEEKRTILLIINDVYNELDIRGNRRNILPLEDMPKRNTGLIELTPAEKYLMGIRERDRDVKKFSKNYVEYNENDCFDICINLEDISDLPIDYKKVKLLTKEELQKIIYRCVDLVDISNLSIDYKKAKLLTKKELQKIRCRIRYREERNER